MKISDLEHLEVIPKQKGKGTPSQVSGGFVFIVATGNSNASGSIAALASVRTQTFTITYPVLLPPLLSF